MDNNGITLEDAVENMTQELLDQNEAVGGRRCAIGLALAMDDLGEGLHLSYFLGDGDELDKPEDNGAICSSATPFFYSLHNDPESTPKGPLLAVDPQTREHFWRPLSDVELPLSRKVYGDRMTSVSLD